MPTTSRPIRAVLYDIDGTLYELGRMRRRMALELGRSALTSPRKTFRDLRIIQAYRRAQEKLRGGDPGTSQFEAAAAALGLLPEELHPVVEEWMEHRPLTLLPQYARQPVLDAIRLLADRGVPQAAYSDYPAHSKIEAFGLTAHFEFHLCSSDPEVGAFKPAPEGFLRAAARWDLHPGGIVYVGDRAEVDGVGAEAAGMRFIHVGQLTPERVRRAAQAPLDSVCGELFGL